MMPQPYHTAGGRGSSHPSGCRKQGAVHALSCSGAGSRVRCTPQPAKVQEAGGGVGGYCTLNRKKAASPVGANSKQMLPSTTDTDSGLTGKGVKVSRSADSKRLIFICTFLLFFLFRITQLTKNTKFLLIIIRKSQIREIKRVIFKGFVFKELPINRSTVKII